MSVLITLHSFQEMAVTLGDLLTPILPPPKLTSNETHGVFQQQQQPNNMVHEPTTGHSNWTTQPSGSQVTASEAAYTSAAFTAVSDNRQPYVPTYACPFKQWALPLRWTENQCMAQTNFAIGTQHETMLMYRQMKAAGFCMPSFQFVMDTRNRLMTSGRCICYNCIGSRIWGPSFAGKPEVSNVEKKRKVRANAKKPEKEILTKEMMEEFERTETRKREDIMCKKCNIKFDTQEELVNHMVQH